MAEVVATIEARVKVMMAWREAPDVVAFIETMDEWERTVKFPVVADG